MTQTIPMEKSKPNTVPDLEGFARRHGISRTVAKAILSNVGGDIEKATEAVKRMKG